MRSLMLAAALALLAVPASAQQPGVMGTWLTASGVGQVKLARAPTRRAEQSAAPSSA
jgi:hypothetical protein